MLVVEHQTDQLDEEDLISMDLLWLYYKSEVYTKKPTALKDFKAAMYHKAK